MHKVGDFSDFSYELAGPEDDAALRRLLAGNPIPGNMTLTYEREPGYFRGCGTMGRFWQVLVARHGPDGKIAAVLCRATQPRFVNGEVTEVGYLGQLRVDHEFRGRGLVSAGVSALRKLHEDGRVGVYVTALIDGNDETRSILVERLRRYSLIFEEVCPIYNLALILRRPMPVPPSPCEVCGGSGASVGEVASFLREHGAAKQFFPVYEEGDFTGGALALGFGPGDFLLARREGELVGVMGLWDQSGYKQSMVRSYGGFLRWGRPLYDLWARAVGAQPLPPPGNKINFAYASFVCMAENDPDVFGVLLRHVYNLATRRGYAYLMVSLTGADPLLPVLRRYMHISYNSRLYTVRWEGEEGPCPRIDDRVPYVEPGAL